MPTQGCIKVALDDAYTKAKEIGDIMMLTGVIMMVSIAFSLPLCSDYKNETKIEEDKTIEDPSPVPMTNMATNS